MRERAAPEGEARASEFPVEPEAFMVWFKGADGEARARAGTALREPGPVSDRLIAAVVASLTADWFPYREFFGSLGARALPALEAAAMQLDAEHGRHVGAFDLVMWIARGNDRRRLFLVFLRSPDEDTRGTVATTISALAGEGLFRVDDSIRRALALALDATPAPSIHAWGSSAHVEIFLALEATLDEEGAALTRLLADENSVVRGVAVAVVPGWVIARATNVYEDDRAREAAEASVVVRGRVAVDRTVPMLSDPDPGVRGRAVQTLAQLADHDELSIPTAPLLACLSNPNEVDYIRGNAALARAELGGDVKADVLPYLDDQSPVVRTAVLRVARESVESSDAPDPDWRPRFVAALDDPDARVRLEAAKGLQPFASPGAACRERLRACLGDPDVSVRLACADSLNRDDALPLETLPHLKSWLTEGSEAERLTALECVLALGERAALLEAPVAALTLTGDAKFRVTVLNRLKWHARGDAILEAVLACASDEAPKVRFAALDVLAERYPDRLRTRDAFERALSDSKPAVVQKGIEYLADRGQATKQVVRASIDLLRSPNAVRWQKEAAIGALGQCGALAATAIPQLLEALDDPPTFAEKTVATAFASLTELAERTVPELVKRGARGHEIAITALAQMDRAAGPHVAAALARLTADERETLERAIRKARRSGR